MSDVFSKAQHVLEYVPELDDETFRKAQIKCASHGKNFKEIRMFLDMLGISDKR